MADRTVTLPNGRKALVRRVHCRAGGCDYPAWVMLTRRGRQLRIVRIREYRMAWTRKGAWLREFNYRCPRHRVK